MKLMGSYFHRLIQENEDIVFWFMVVLGGLLVLRFVLEYLALCPRV